MLRSVSRSARTGETRTKNSALWKEIKNPHTLPREALASACEQTLFHFRIAADGNGATSHPGK